MCATTWPTSSAPAWKVCAASARWTGAWWTASPSPRNLPPPSMKPPHAWPKAAPAPPRRTATLTLKAPTGAQPTDIAGIEAAGAAWWPLALARQLDDAILNRRTNELDIGTWLLKTEGDAQAVLASDAALIAHQDHWLVRETIGALRRTFALLDVSSRSPFALVASGSGVGGRPHLHARPARRCRARAQDHAQRIQLRPAADGERPEPPATPLLRRSHAHGGSPLGRRQATGRRCRSGTRPGHRRPG